LVAVVSWNTKSWPLPSFTSATKSATTCTPAHHVQRGNALGSTRIHVRVQQ
jgi:hypothetical protein